MNASMYRWPKCRTHIRLEFNQSASSGPAHTLGDYHLALVPCADDAIHKCIQIALARKDALRNMRTNSGSQAFAAMPLTESA